MHFPQATFPASTILSWGQRSVFFKNSSKLCLGILERIILCCALEHLALIWVDSSICVEMSSICYISRRRIFACMGSLMNSGKSIYLLKKCLPNSQSLHLELTLPEMGCKKKTGSLQLLFIVTRGCLLWLSTLALDLVLIKLIGNVFSL